MAETNAPSVKKYVDYAQQQVDEQAILDKYNAATLAQFNIQREQNRQAENQFYNQMYNTQKTTMDTIRQSNAAAVSSGASRGVQAANELSALLGLQQESVASATELAQANRQTAQEETAAVLENVLNAYQQASQERYQLVSQGIEAASVDAQEAANQISAMQAQAQLKDAASNEANTLQQAATNGIDQYLSTLGTLGKDYSGEATTEGAQSLNTALGAIETQTPIPGEGDFERIYQTSEGVRNITATYEKNIQAICETYGLNYADYKSYIDQMYKETEKHTGTDYRKYYAERYKNAYMAMKAKIYSDYMNKLNK